MPIHRVVRDGPYEIAVVVGEGYNQDRPHVSLYYHNALLKVYHLPRDGFEPERFNAFAELQDAVEAAKREIERVRPQHLLEARAVSQVLDKYLNQGNVKT